MSAPVRLDLVDASDGPPGVVWSAEPSELNVNLVALPAGASIARHTNAEVDVLVVAVVGTATVVVDGVAHELVAPSSLLVARGAERGVEAGPEGVRYLSVHRARAPLTVGGRR